MKVEFIVDVVKNFCESFDVSVDDVVKEIASINDVKLVIRPYSEKSFSIEGNTKPVKDVLNKVKNVSWNESLQLWVGANTSKKELLSVLKKKNIEYEEAEKEEKPKPKITAKKVEAFSDSEDEKPAKKVTKKVAKKDSDSEDEEPKKDVKKSKKVDSEDEEEPKKDVKKDAKKDAKTVTKKSKKVDSDSDDDEPKKPTKAVATKSKKVDSDSEDDEPKKSTKKPAAKKTFLIVANNSAAKKVMNALQKKFDSQVTITDDGYECEEDDKIRKTIEKNMQTQKGEYEECEYE